MPLVTDWIMVGITVIYVIATILICLANFKSAKATHAQIVESKRQFGETKRLEHMPYMQVAFGDWVPREERGSLLPTMWLDINRNNKKTSVSSGMSIEVVNIGLGLAVNIGCKWISGDINEDHHLSVELLKQDESCKSSFIVSAAAPETESYSEKTQLVICFDDFLGNHYEQTIEVTFEIRHGNISLVYYSVKTPEHIKSNV